MTRLTTALLAFALLLLSINCHAATIPNGYEDIRWGTMFHKIVEAYPKGKMAEYDKQMVYTQEKPDETIASRMFVFKDGLLVSVAVTFEGKYVSKTGVEKLKQKFMQQYGKGKAGKQGTHMSTYVWNGKQTKVSFLYVPNHPEMTVLQFEKI